MCAFEHAHSCAGPTVPAAPERLIIAGVVCDALAGGDGPVRFVPAAEYRDMDVEYFLHVVGRSPGFMVGEGAAEQEAHKGTRIVTGSRQRHPPFKREGNQQTKGNLPPFPLLFLH